MADSTPAKQTQEPSAQQQNQDLPPTISDSQLTPPAAALPPPPPTAETSSGKRPRGRPRGSKSKPNPPVSTSEEDSSTQRHIQLVIPPGCDLVAVLENFARQYRTGIHLEGGYGRVANITLEPFGTPIPGIVDLVHLAGTFLDPYMYKGSMEGAFPAYIPGSPGPWMKMILSSGHTWLISQAYVVAGAITVTDVLVNIITFRHFEVQRLELSMFAFQEPANPPPPNMTAMNFFLGGEANGSGFGGYARKGSEMPPSGFRLPGGDAQSSGILAPGLRLPGSEQRDYTPSGGVSFRPPNYRNALNIGGSGEASGSGISRDAQVVYEMPAPGSGLPGGEKRNYTPSGGVGFRAFRPLNNRRNALNIGGGGEVSGSGIGGDVQGDNEMPAPRFGLPGGEQRNYAPSGGVGFRPPNYRKALNIGGGGEASGSGTGGEAEVENEMPAPDGKQRNYAPSGGVGFRPPNYPKDRRL